MSRRDFLLAAGALAVAPHALAQGVTRMPRVALVETVDPVSAMVEGPHSYWGAMLVELRRLGQVEGRNVALERWSAGGAASGGAYRDLARKVVASNPNVIVVRGRSLLVPFVAETKDLPIVAVATISADLRQSNVTGVNTSFDTQQLYGKQVEVLGLVLKQGTRIAYLSPKIVWEGTSGEAARKGARAAKLALEPVLVPSPMSKTAVRRAFAEVARLRHGAVLVSPATEFFPFRETITEQAVLRGLPTLGPSRRWAEAGALLSYGADTDHIFRRGAQLVERILQGAQPAAVPIENPTKVELYVNLETARALNLMVPQSLIARADRVIE